MQREFPGEPYPADVAEKKFKDTVLARIEGTEAEIRLTTDLYVARYPIEAFATEAWGDARFMGWLDRGVPFYQLLVFRRFSVNEGQGSD